MGGSKDHTVTCDVPAAVVPTSNERSYAVAITTFNYSHKKLQLITAWHNGAPVTIYSSRSSVGCFTLVLRLLTLSAEPLLQIWL